MYTGNGKYIDPKGDIIIEFFKDIFFDEYEII